jgi:DNA (cytosine-5)-methyltransferase 1
MKLSKEALKALSTKLNYHVTFQVLNANKFGVPQNRERIYLVGFDKDQAPKDFDFSKQSQRCRDRLVT